MKKVLGWVDNDTLYHYVDGKIVVGANPNMHDYYYHLAGNCSGIRGDCTGLYGDCTGLSGDLDDCKLTREDREKGINIRDLLGE
jgi:hypothetical protein